MIILGLDTETTGFPNARLDARDPKQGRVCQLALKLITTEGRILAQFSSLIRPDGWEMSEGAQKVHGHSIEDCEAYGVHVMTAWKTFMHMAAMADMIVAHNSEFDLKMMMMEANALEQNMIDTPWHCTMKQATPICKIPPTPKMRAAGFGPYKSANLTEALKIICNKDLEGAHDAMVDVNGCLDLFLALQEKAA